MKTLVPASSRIVRHKAGEYPKANAMASIPPLLVPAQKLTFSNRSGKIAKSLLRIMQFMRPKSERIVQSDIAERMSRLIIALPRIPPPSIDNMRNFPSGDDVGGRSLVACKDQALANKITDGCE